MAAILCSAVCVKPCELCGKGCEAACKCLGSSCKCLCDACDECNKCVGRYCNFVCEFLDMPFSSFLLFAYCINAAGLAIGVIGLGKIALCQTPDWSLRLLIGVIAFAVNIVFGIYLHIKLVIWFRQHSGEDQEGGLHGQQRTWAEKNTIKRRVVQEAWKFFKYDVFFALYLLVCLASLGYGFFLLSTKRTCTDPVGAGGGEMIKAGKTTGLLLVLYEAIGFWLVIARMLISFCADCLDDANLWTVLFCCFYYPFFYDAEKAGRSRREREAREAAEFDARRGQTPAVNSDLAGPDRQYMSDDRPVHQQQRPPVHTSSYQNASETSPSWDQQPGAVQTPIMHPPPGMAHQPVMHPPPGVAQVATPIAQPINPQREGQPASSSNTLTGGDVAAAAVKGTIAMGKIALGVLSAAGQAGAKYVAEEKARQKQASDSGGYGGQGR